jgi:hypothetical protein
MKEIALARLETPAKVEKALPACRHPPTVSAEPGELVAGRTGMGAPRSGTEAADFENDSMGIGKGVPLSPIHCQGLFGPGNRVAAVAAGNHGSVARHLVRRRIRLV